MADELVGICRLGGRDHLLTRRIRLAVGDVLRNRQGQDK